jgi:hypothetical protein
VTRASRSIDYRSVSQASTAVVISLVIAQGTGCASLGERQVRSETVILATSERQETKSSAFARVTRVDNVNLVVQAERACSRRTVFRNDDVETWELVNESVYVDVLLGLLGGAVAGAGATLLATPSARLSRNDLTAVRGLGIGSVVAGSAMLTIPIVDGIRASGLPERTNDEGETHRVYSSDGPVVVAAEVCGAKGVTPDWVEVGSLGELPDVHMLFDGEFEYHKWKVASLQVGNSSTVDLSTLVPDEVLRLRQRPSQVRIRLEDTVVLAFAAADILEAADDRAWSALAEARKLCAAPVSDPPPLPWTPQKARPCARSVG